MKHARIFRFALVMIFTWFWVDHTSAQSKSKNQAPIASSRQGTVVTETLTSTILRDNLVGLNPQRSVKIYLPPGYATSGMSYPVVYYCHNLFNTPAKVFEETGMAKLLDLAIEKGVIKPVIFVVGDYSTDGIGTFYENSVVSGRWLDYTVQELVPFIDGKFRTLRARDSRAVSGHFMGGRGALKRAMDHADLFGVVYALHPVATGTGYLPWSAFPSDWKVLRAKSPDELKTDFMLALSRAFLPNPQKPPFYCDFFMSLENGALKLDPEKTAKAQDAFLLDRMLTESASNLRSMRGVAFDWARHDTNQDHVYANRAFTAKLDDWGIVHEAEEYHGGPFDTVWGEQGRFYTRLLPFLSRWLLFEKQP